MAEPFADLWTPSGVSQNGIAVLAPRSMGPRPQAHTYKFTFRYKGKEKQILVAAAPGDSRAEIEDRAAKAAESWVNELNQQERKRAPTPEEKKQIGKALNDFYRQARKRRESTNGRIWYQGVH